MSFKTDITLHHVVTFYLKLGRNFEFAHTSSNQNNEILNLLLQDLHMQNNARNRKRVSKFMHRHAMEITTATANRERNRPAEHINVVVPTTVIERIPSTSATQELYQLQHTNIDHGIPALNTAAKQIRLQQLSSTEHEHGIEFGKTTWKKRLIQRYREEIMSPESRQNNEKVSNETELHDLVNSTLLNFNLISPPIKEKAADHEYITESFQPIPAMRTPLQDDWKGFSSDTEMNDANHEETFVINPLPKETAVVTNNVPLNNETIFPQCGFVKEDTPSTSGKRSRSGGVDEVKVASEDIEFPLYNATEITHDDPVIHSLLDQLLQVKNSIITKQKIKYSMMHGFLILPAMRIFENESNAQSNRSTLYSFLRKNIIHLHLSCILNMKGYNLRSSDRMVYYGHCSHKYDKASCKKRFRFDVVFQNEIGIAMIHSNGEPECHEEQRVAQARGSDRDQLKGSLFVDTPSRYRTQKVRESDTLQLDLGNLQEIRSLSVLQKINEEIAKENLKSQHDFQDLIMRYEEEKFGENSNPEMQYIQYVQQPLSVQCFSAYIIKHLKAVLKQRDKRNTFVLYLDATGSLIRSQRTKALEGPIYYYAGVVFVDGLTIPILESISNEHTMEAISSFLLHFKSFCKEQRRWPLFSIVVVDFSYALIHAVTLVWNEMSLANYLSVCFAYYQNKIAKVNIKKLLLVHICCAHMIGIIKRFCGQRKLKGKVKWFIMEVMALLIQCQSLDRAVKVISRFLYILQSKYLDENVESRLNDLKELLPEIDPMLQAEIDKPEVEKDELILVTEQLEDGLRKNSPFGNMGVRMNTAVRIEVRAKNFENSKNLNSIKNVLYCPAFAERLVKLYIPLLPLWTAIMLHVVFPDGNVTRLANANIESWFKKVKTDIFQGEKNKRPGIFVQTMKDQVFTMVKELVYVTRSKTKRKYVRKVTKNSATDEKLVELEDDNSDQCDNDLQPILTSPTKKRKKNDDGLSLSSPAPKKAKKNYVSPSSTKKRNKNDDDSRNAVITEKWRKRKKTRFSLFHGHNISKFGSKKDASTDKIKTSSSPAILVQQTDQTAVSSRHQVVDRTTTNLPSTSSPTLQTKSHKNVNAFSYDHNYSILSYGGKSTTCTTTLSLSEELLNDNWIRKREEVRDYSIDYRYKNSDWFLSYATKDELLNLFEETPMNEQDPTGGAELDQSIIDECSFTFINRYLPTGTRIVYVPMCYGIIGHYTSMYKMHDISEKKEISKEMFEVNVMNWSTADMLLIPVLPSQGHFSLIVIDMVKKSLTYYDPLQISATDLKNKARNMLRMFLQYLTVRNQYTVTDIIITRIEEWNIKVVTEYQRQSDLFNCGVYVLWYIYQLLRGASLNEQTNAKHFRKIICWHLFPTTEIVNSEMKTKQIYPHPYTWFVSGLFQDVQYYCGNFVSGLFQDVQYYCGSPDFSDQYVVAKFSNLFKDPVFITGTDLRSLTGTNWLTGNVIDGCLSALLNDYNKIKRDLMYEQEFVLLGEDLEMETDFKYVPFRVLKTIHASLLLNKDLIMSYDFAKNVRLLPISDTIRQFVLPFNVSGNHWVVLFIDTGAHNYQFYDPSGSVKWEDEVLAEWVATFISHYNTLLPENAKIKFDNTWPNTTPSYYPTQMDDHSCGLMVIIYIFYFVFDNYISINGLRERLQMKLLCCSRNMTELCLYCGHHITARMFRRNRDVQWVLCKTCRRWVHYSCIKAPKPNFEDLNNSDFQCVLCDHVRDYTPPKPENKNILEKTVRDPFSFYIDDYDDDHLSTSNK